MGRKLDMRYTQREIRHLYIKQLHHDALYLHFIHKGYTSKQAELEATRRLKVLSSKLLG